MYNVHFFCVKVVDINVLIEIQIYYENETVSTPLWVFLSFFLMLLARSNFDHYAREYDFGIVKKTRQVAVLFIYKK